MKNAGPYTGKWLREWFPEQTKSVKSILIWSLVYIADTILVFWLAAKLGFDLMQLPYQLVSVVAGLYLIIALVLFWVETTIYNKLLSNYRKTEVVVFYFPFPQQHNQS